MRKTRDVQHWGRKNSTRGVHRFLIALSLISAFFFSSCGNSAFYNELLRIVNEHQDWLNLSWDLYVVSNGASIEHLHYDNRTITLEGSVSPSAGVNGIEVNSAGSNLYGGVSENLVAYEIDSDGNLINENLISGNNFSGYTQFMEISPDGENLYFPYNPDSSSHYLRCLQLSGTTITYLSLPAAQYWPRTLFAHPNGNYLYSTHKSQYQIRVWSRSPSDGALSSSSIESYNIYYSPMVIHPEGFYLYAVYAGDKGVHYIPLSSDGGTVNSAAAETLTLSATPQGIAVNPSGSHVYVSADDGTIRVYPIESDGSLSSAAVQIVTTYTSIDQLEYISGGSLVGSCPAPDNKVVVWRVGYDGLLKTDQEVSINNPTDLAAVPGN